MARIGLGPLRKPIRAISRQLPPLNFITLHYIYFIGTSLLTAIIFWGSSTPSRSISFTNSLFLTVSAMTLAGLNTINLSELNTFQQFLMFLLIIMGGTPFVSAAIVHVRRNAFKKKFQDIDTKRRSWRGRSRSRSRGRASNTQALSSRATTTDLASSEQQRSEKDPDEKEQEGLGETPVRNDSAEDEDEHKRDTTPPARRGGPEMNGISSKTGERLEFEPMSPSEARNPGIAFAPETRFRPHRPRSLSRRRSSYFNMTGVGALPMASVHSTSRSFEQARSLPRSESIAPSIHGYRDPSRYFENATGWIARNSQFHGLSEKEREKLGGCEYRAVIFLSWIVPLYFILWQLFGALGCAGWVAANTPSIARRNGLNPWWVGAFNAISAFNNSGMSLLDANMVAFQRSYYMLLTMGLLILAGNTCYPVFLRLIIWCIYKIVERQANKHPELDSWKERARTLRFLLDHPRRCYTNLFPSQHTWWLALSVFTLNGIDWAAFEILNIGNSELDNGLPARWRVIDGLFQAFAVRSGGFYVVAIPTLRVSLQVLYVVMMYISVYPVSITIRNSNIYEERSLGLYAEDLQNEAQDNSNQVNEKSSPKKYPDGFALRSARTIRDHFLVGGAVASSSENNGHFVRQQLRAQLAHDIWWLFLAIFLIMICEGHKFHTDPVVYSVFNVIFETVSAYGTVGISIGVPWADYSFSGAWNTLSKLILCAVMIRGRHRGLPVAIDKAVMLPGEEQEGAEEEDGRIRLARSMTRGRQEDV